ncbi:Flp pilus assembly complex ATPase component TadA [Cereibacter sphaeroides]|uniref:GspE/PulE family protein n=1 Tax=Cereibacter sphaeroides TaxID=1063 RepID=UPI001F30D3AB|nr:ATPase, T2SS/T4P/T4SS family [Cereibacter sphaeroides]MCE6959710.1 Flp pilus assembly complex ATPase component TadA [Cereibacter sphaeroides]MCE6974429.1 Flp pilus assembly complex ATPase component TadA [Cereibacter sphaeroides]
MSAMTPVVRAPGGPHDIRHLISGGQPVDLGAVFLERGLIGRKALHAARMEREVVGGRIGHVLVRNGLLSQKDMIRTILEVAPEELASERVAHARVPIDTLRRHGILLAAETTDSIYVSTLAYEDTALRIVSQWYPDKKVCFVPYDPAHMSEFLVRMQMQIGAGSGEVREDERLEDLIFRAYDRGASDIHINPKSRSYSVFFRIMGERHLVHEGTLSEFRALIAQIKNKAGMDIAENRIPQDGVFNMEFASKVVDFRTVTVPVQHGEYVVMRILDPDAVRNNLDTLGITRVEHWRRGFNQPTGLCLICGPTGSGKTTTLNATVSEMDRFGDAIFTVEDPVEYPIAYAGQVSVNRAVGLDYPRALRAFMRADPNVMNIGEVRDEETAAIMIKAAETGHLVLATLHASTIRGAISRLEHLGIDRMSLAETVRAIMVQNLIRTVCSGCKGAGCEACFDSGYAGRKIVSEVQSFRNPAEVERMMEGETFWPTLIEDAVAQMDAGKTDARELARVYGSVFEEEMRKRAERASGVDLTKRE